MRPAHILVLLLGVYPGLVAAQDSEGMGVVVRADMAAQDPSYAQGIHLAWGLAAGVRIGAHSNFLLDLSRQNLSEELGGESVDWQTFLGGAWEYAFGAQEIERRQGMTILRVGLLLRDAPIHNAPYLGVGLGLRYPVAPWIQFQARIEDDFDFPPRQILSSCIAPGYCSPVSFGGKAEQNLGLFLGVEVHS